MAKRTRKPSVKSKNDISDIVDAVKVIKLNPKTLAVAFTTIGLFLLLSIVSYDRNDLTSNLSVWSSWRDVFNGSVKSNWLGIVGANVSKFFFMHTFGYGALIFGAWGMYIGLQFFREAKKNLFFPSNVGLFLNLVFWVGILLALPESVRTLGHHIDYFPSGLIGGLLSDLSVRMFGKYGAILLFSLYTLGLMVIYLPSSLREKLIGIRLPKINFPKFSLHREEPKGVDEEPEDVATDVLVPVTINEKRNVQIDTEGDIASDTIHPKKNNEPSAFPSFQKTIEEKPQSPLPETYIQKPKPMSENQLFTEEPAYVRRRDRKVVDTPLLEEEMRPQVKSSLQKSSVEQMETEELSEKIVEPQFKSFIDESDLKPAGTLYTNFNYDSDELEDEPENEPSLFEEEPFEFIPQIETEETLASEPEFTIEEEVEEAESDLDKVQKQIGKRERYVYPPVDLLYDPPVDNRTVTDEELWHWAKILEDKLLDFKVIAKVVNVVSGPVITMFELRPDVGVRVSKIETLMPDIALSLSARGIRFLGQIPGKDTLGIEIPNHHRKLVTFKDIINSQKFVECDYDLPVALGKGVNGEIVIGDLADMPHVLVAGATGSGKSVGVNSMIASLLYRKHPDDLKFVMIDPKMLELSLYNKLENHHLAFSSDLDEKVITKPENALGMLEAVVEEMEDRYRYLADNAVRNIKEFNRRVAGKPLDPHDPEQGVHNKLPYIVVIIDELADLMMTTNKAVEEPIARLTQKARAVGIHCIIATQRPSVDVITGIIKANVPTRVAFQTASKIDSRTILDLMGAEQLLGKGDMLYLPPGQAKAKRIQNAFLSTEEIEDVVKHVAGQPFSKHLNLRIIQQGGSTLSSGDFGSIAADERDPLYEKAKEVVVQSQSGSISMIQRKLKVGYARAGKIIDQLEDAGIVGPYSGSTAREVYMLPEELDGSNF